MSDTKTYIDSVIVFSIILYCSSSIIQLPHFISSLFKNDIFKFMFLALLLINNLNATPPIALFISIFFILTQDKLDKDDYHNEFDYIEGFQEFLKSKYKNTKYSVKK